MFVAMLNIIKAAIRPAVTMVTPVRNVAVFIRKNKMTTREEVYRAIDSELDYQASVWKNPEDSGAHNPLTVGEFILLVEQYTARARQLWTSESKQLAHTDSGACYYTEVQTLEFMRKIAGIAANCMTQHGAPQREGFEVV